MAIHVEFGSGFCEAVETAQNAIVVQREIVAPEHWREMMIVLHRGEYRVFSTRAWQEPTGNVLPWKAPEGEHVAYVDCDGELEMLGAFIKAA